MIWPRKGSREAGTLASWIPWGLRLWAMAGQLLAWLSSLPTAVVYGSLSLFVTILHNVFLLYYVDTFVSVYKIDKLAFWVGETVFLLWNSLNDPLFGWLSDRVFLSSPPSAAGSLSVFASYTVWNKEDFSSFRVFCVVLAVCSGLGFTGATWLLRQRFETEGRTLGALHSASESPDVEKPSANEEEKRVTLGEYLQQLARHRNFLWFVGMNLVQVFHCHFNSNFFPLFLEHLLSDQISLSMGSFLLGVSYIAPHLNNLYFLALCQRWGVYAVVRGLFLLKLGLSLLMLLAGPDHLHLLCIFIASNRVFTEGTCKLLTLVVTDLVDEDLVLNRRKQAASALLFGMVALVTKPGQTFAPLLGTWLLCFYTGHDLFHQPLLTPVGSARPWLEPPAPPRAPTLRQGCFYLLVLVPIMCALLQLITWSQFTLHGRRLHMIKAQRQSLSKPWNLDIKTV
ncbi:transmembrane protein 180 isoform X2 [Notamacropus eugenii]|uniref:transmembrane protein 180 isoform X2 n=1 Tax=Notamacropus eugenii TaxID=9315 RepID=UPI003B67717C